MHNLRQIFRFFRVIAGLNLLLALVSPFISAYGPPAHSTVAQAQTNTIALSLLLFLLCHLFAELCSSRHTRFQSSLAYIGIIVAFGMFLAGVCVGLLHVSSA
jgi:uncharacterized protein YacL